MFKSNQKSISRCLMFILKIICCFFSLQKIGRNLNLNNINLNNILNLINFKSFLNISYYVTKLHLTFLSPNLLSTSAVNHWIVNESSRRHFPSIYMKFPLDLTTLISDNIARECTLVLTLKLHLKYSSMMETKICISNFNSIFSEISRLELNVKFDAS